MLSSSRMSGLHTCNNVQVGGLQSIDAGKSLALFLLMANHPRSLRYEMHLTAARRMLPARLSATPSLCQIQMTYAAGSVTANKTYQ